MSIYPEIQLILLFLNSDNDIPNICNYIATNKQLNWEKFSNFTIKHGLAAFLYKKICIPELIPLVPDTILSLFKQQYYKTFARNTVFIENIKLIAEQTSKNNIELILLKGISLIDNIYEDIGLRQMSDIDVLVKNKDIHKIINILESLNYATNPVVKSKLINNNLSFEHFHLPAYINKTNHVMIELHTHIHTEKSALNIDICEFWKNKVLKRTFNTNVGMLSPENLLQHLCIHINEHFQYKNIRLSHFYDVAKVIEKYDNNGLDWDKFIDDTIKYNIQKAVFPHLYLTQKYFNINLPPVVSSHFNDLDKAAIDKYFIDILFIHSISSKELAEMKKEEINNFTGFRNKLIYITGDLFPSKRFMISRYKIKFKQLFFIYYIKRWLSAISRLFFMVFSREKS